MTPDEPPTRAQAITAAADALINGVRQRAALSPREAAEAAWYPGHPLGTVDAIEAKIRARRAAQAPRRHSPAA